MPALATQKRATAIPGSIALSAKTFRKISDLIYGNCGIVLREGKEDLVHARLSKRLRALELDSFEAYLELVACDADERTRMVDVLTTNKTNFFRESAHFELMRETLFPVWTDAGRPIRIWSAACSSGEEPYTIAMTLLDHAPHLARNTKILATDISTTVLERAKRGVYTHESLEEVPPPQRKKHFERVSDREQRVSPKVRELITFGRLNLLERWPMRGKFQLIFCRNVMIYFDKDTQVSLARRFSELLEPGGLLFIGHSESLGQADTGLRYEHPAVYSR
jgi:chemotaxis protein methyltransferase CheR